jgi:hypothetical protein
MSSDDQFFRSQLSGRPVSGDADFALNSLKPTMKRARLRRQAAVGAMTVALVGMGGAGVAAVSSSRATPTLQTSSAPAETRSATESSEPSYVATGTNEADDGGSSRGVDAVGGDGEPSQSSVTPASSDTQTSSEVSDSSIPAVSAPGQPAVASPAGTTVPSAPTVTIAAPVVPPFTTAAPVVPSAQPATTPTSTKASAGATTTPTSAAGEEAITSSCGVVTVGFSGDSVNLLVTQPGSGYEVDVKNAGPQEVEVGFAGGGKECEVKARMQSGQFTYSVDNHDS